jgi:ABC-type multidrug transport system fused ATPase/permease subunit
LISSSGSKLIELSEIKGDEEIWNELGLEDNVVFFFNKFNLIFNIYKVCYLNNASFRWSSSSEDGNKAEDESKKKDINKFNKDGKEKSENTKGRKKKPIKEDVSRSNSLPTDSLEMSSPSLSNVSISVKRGTSTMVIGSVGCGKSSLLNALLGELICTDCVEKNNFSMNESSSQTSHLKGFVKGKVGYASQIPFIINASVKDNITFGFVIFIIIFIIIIIIYIN